MTMGRVALVVLLAGTTLGTVAGGSAQPPDGNAVRGAAVFRQCVACHSVEPGVHLTGPSLARVFDHRAGTVEGFTRYSEPLKGATVVWDAESLDRCFEDPQAVVPRNLMTFPGLKDAGQRADLVAYLKAVAMGQAPPATLGGRMMMGPARPDLKALGPERRVKANAGRPDIGRLLGARGDQPDHRAQVPGGDESMTSVIDQSGTLRVQYLGVRFDSS